MIYLDVEERIRMREESVKTMSAKRKFYQAILDALRQIGSDVVIVVENRGSMEVYRKRDMPSLESKIREYNKDILSLNIEIRKLKTGKCGVE
ncbi:hypothetical protein DRN50_07265 [Thermococci archaeon]|nr:MAG: hypothetical protein DRN50_07265 [Thermococci archaeon]